MKVGNVAETITVTGRDAHRGPAEHDDARPSSRGRRRTRCRPASNMFNLGVLIPGVTLTTGGLANQDVGGALGPNTLALGIHGGQTQDQRLTMNGVSLSTMIGGGWGGGTIPNQGGRRRDVVRHLVGGREPVDGRRPHQLHRQGRRQQVRGTVFANFANDSMQGSNYTQRLKDARPHDARRHREELGLQSGFRRTHRQGQAVVLPVGPQPGREHVRAGTVLQQEREQSERVDLRARFGAACDAQSLLAGLSTPASRGRRIPRTSSGSSYNIQSNCFCPFGINSLTAPEAGNDQRFPLQRPIVVDWTSPVTSKLLLEGSAIHRIERWGAMDPSDARAWHDFRRRSGSGRVQAGHDLSIGRDVQQQHQHDIPLGAQGVVYHRRSCSQGRRERRVGSNDATTYTRLPLAYTFLTPVGAAPTPVSLTEDVTPYTTHLNVDHDFGLFAQDKWTRGRSTIIARDTVRPRLEQLSREHARSDDVCAEPQHHVPRNAAGQLV